MKKFEPKTGMWRCRDGKVRTVTNIEPTWVKRRAPLEGYGVEDGHLVSYRWYAEGTFSFVAASCDLIEHLSDEIADPRTWEPPVTLCEGVWEFEDGSRGVAVSAWDSQGHAVFFVHGNYARECILYSPLGKPVSAHSLPKAVRFIGPLPTGEE